MISSTHSLLLVQTLARTTIAVSSLSCTRQQTIVVTVLGHYLVMTNPAEKLASLFNNLQVF